MNDLPAGVIHFILLGFLGFVLVFLLGGDPQELRLQLRLFLSAFALRFAFSIAIYQLGLVSVLKDEDSSGWTAGVGLQEHWLRHGMALWQLPSALAGAFEGHDRGYGYLLGGMFYLTGAPSRLGAAALNGFVGALTVIIVWRVARRLFSPWVAAQAGWWTCFFPSMIIWSAQTVKEPAIIFLEAVALYSCVRLRQLGPSPRPLAVCAATVVLLLPFRPYAAFIMGIAVLVALLVRGLVPGRATFSTVALLALLIPVVFGTQAFARHTAELEQFDLNRAQSFRTNVARGGEKYGGNSGVTTADVRTSGGFVRGVTVGAAHLLLAPFPWELGGASLRMLLTLPELLFWWWLFFAGVVPGLHYAIRHRLISVSPLLLVLIGFGLLYSLMFGNIGLAFRQRAQLLPWLLIFAAVGLEQRALRQIAVRKAWLDAYPLAEARS